MTLLRLFSKLTQNNCDIAFNNIQGMQLQISHTISHSITNIPQKYYKVAQKCDIVTQNRVFYYIM